VVATALLDRLLHHATVIQTEGASYRLREHADLVPENMMLIQNDRVTHLAVGDVAILDSTRPVTYHSENRPGRWLGRWCRIWDWSWRAPCAGAAKHPRAACCSVSFRRRLAAAIYRSRRPTPICSSRSTPARRAVCGARWAAISTHSDKLFMRVCAIIKARFADPDLDPSAVAAEAGISLRYLQKLFTLRGSACSHFIYSARLDHAARLIQRRAATRTEQPLSVIAYACGFRDYTHFARAFRNRFGYPPGVGGTRAAGNYSVRVHADAISSRWPPIRDLASSAVWGSPFTEHAAGGEICV
jgi:AraC family transcriptional regulator, positive regulator of tynA and feaB